MSDVTSAEIISALVNFISLLFIIMKTSLCHVTMCHVCILRLLLLCEGYLCLPHSL